MPTAKFRKFGLSSPLEGLNVDKIFEPETFALVSRMTTPPTTQRKRQMDTLIRALKLAGVWSKLDALWITAAADAQAACLNWISAQSPLTPFGTLTFTADQGYKGDGVSGYFDTGFNALGAQQLQQDDAMISAWVKDGTITDAVISYATAGGNLWLTPTTAGGTISARVNSASSATLSGVVARTGLFTAGRDSATHILSYRNGASAGGATSASTARTAFNSALLRRGTVFADDTLLVAAFGAGRTAAQELAFYSALQTYLQSLGLAV